MKLSFFLTVCLGVLTAASAACKSNKCSCTTSPDNCKCNECGCGSGCRYRRLEDTQRHLEEEQSHECANEKYTLSLVISEEHSHPMLVAKPQTHLFTCPLLGFHVRYSHDSESITKEAMVLDYNDQDISFMAGGSYDMLKDLAVQDIFGAFNKVEAPIKFDVLTDNCAGFLLNILYELEFVPNMDGGLVDYVADKFMHNRDALFAAVEGSPNRHLLLTGQRLLRAAASDRALISKLVKGYVKRHYENTRM